jgi:hypothetical protein
MQSGQLRDAVLLERRLMDLRGGIDRQQAEIETLRRQGLDATAATAALAALSGTLQAVELRLQTLRATPTHTGYVSPRRPRRS